MNRGEQVIASFWDVLQKMMWLDTYKMKERLKDYKPSEIHCIEYLEEYTDVNVTKLADAFYLTRSATSKITSKLMDKGLIESYQKPDNKKEIYFRLTEQGSNIFKIHEKLHKEFSIRDQEVFEQVTEEQYNSMISFAEKYSRHLDLEIQKLCLDKKSGGFDKL